MPRESPTNIISQCLSMISAKFLEYADRQTIGLFPFFFYNLFNCYPIHLGVLASQIYY